MKKHIKNIFTFVFALILSSSLLNAQTEPDAGQWKTWFISSGKDFRLSAPASHKGEITEIISVQKNITPAVRQQILHWNAGSPGYRWQEMMNQLWPVDTNRYAILANLLLSTAIYDATIAAWDSKYIFKQLRSFEADKRIKLFIPKPESPSYPCEYSVAAGVAVVIFSKFYPALADSVNRMAQQLMQSRIAAGVAFPSDTRKGFELGKQIAEREIEYTKDYISKEAWNGKTPDGPNYWKGRFAMLPMAGKNKTVVLKSGSQLRPLPPPDYAKEMAELKNYKQNFRSLSNAFYWANEVWFSNELTKKIFENNLHLNAPAAAQIHAIINIGMYDGFVSCWDAKYAFWGIRPNQYDTTFRPSIIITPPFPGYPSGHAMLAAVQAGLMSYFFPDKKELYWRKAKEAAESRFQAGIHFRSDNEIALQMGSQLAEIIIQKIKNEGFVEMNK